MQAESWAKCTAYALPKREIPFASAADHINNLGLQSRNDRSVAIQVSMFNTRNFANEV